MGCICSCSYSPQHLGGLSTPTLPAAAFKYMPACLVQWRELFSVPEDLAYSPVMIQPLPQRGQAMLIVVGGQSWPAFFVFMLCGNEIEGWQWLFVTLST